jgi:hypothetical protein
MTELQQIEAARKEAQEQIDIAEHLEKLQKNRSFNKVFNEYILKELAVNAASLYGRPELNEMSTKSIQNTLTMISTLNDTLSRISTKANEAEQRLVEIDEAEAEYLEEVEGA